MRMSRNSGARAMRSAPARQYAWSSPRPPAQPGRPALSRRIRASQGSRRDRRPVACRRAAARRVTSRSAADTAQSCHSLRPDRRPDRLDRGRGEEPARGVAVPRSMPAMVWPCLSMGRIALAPIARNIPGRAPKSADFAVRIRANEIRIAAIIRAECRFNRLAGAFLGWTGFH